MKVNFWFPHTLNLKMLSSLFLHVIIKVLLMCITLKIIYILAKTATKEKVPLLPKSAI